jgi:hypothetical protein
VSDIHNLAVVDVGYITKLADNTRELAARETPDGKVPFSTVREIQGLIDPVVKVATSVSTHMLMKHLPDAIRVIFSAESYTSALSTAPGRVAGATGGRPGRKTKTTAAAAAAAAVAPSTTKTTTKVTITGLVEILSRNPGYRDTKKAQTIKGITKQIGDLAEHIKGAHGALEVAMKALAATAAPAPVARGGADARR